MSIPTSLIVVILVAAWLAVLVPMVARRREQVPETDTDGGTFRVLRRASASMRRRPGLGRRQDREEDDITEHDDSDGFSGDELRDPQAVGNERLYSDDDRLDDGFPDDQDGAGSDSQSPSAHEPRPVGRRGSRSIARRDLSVMAAPVEAEDEEAEYPAVAAGTLRPVGDGSPVAYDTRYDDSMDEVDETQLRPVPRRPGRGGYDPDAAEVARAYRYSRRRRVTVVLLLATVAFSAGAYFVKPVLWSGAAVFGLLLIGYLCYLRRQVRIENDIRERRSARLRRARQIRPEYHMHRAEAPVVASPFASPSGAGVDSAAPSAGYRRGREIVDLDDDDPSFEDLEYHEAFPYRRASGQ